MPVPVLVSRMLLELYNANIQGVLSSSGGSLRVPQLGESAFIGLGFGARLGEGFLGEARDDAGQARTVKTLRLRVVGFSSRAIAIGVTVPLPYVQRWNAEYVDAERAARYDSVLVETVDSRALHRAADHVTRDLGWAIDARYQDAQRASVMLTLVTASLALLSVLILGLAALNVMNTFLMLVGERRREIGVLRALGATRFEVVLLVVSEALAIAWTSWAVALGLAIGSMRAADVVFARSVPDFPFKPDTLFWMPFWLVVGSLGVATAACVLGAWLPARRAGSLDPVDATRNP